MVDERLAKEIDKVQKVIERKYGKYCVQKMPYDLDGLWNRDS